jgi:hypothetical protein
MTPLINRAKMVKTYILALLIVITFSAATSAMPIILGPLNSTGDLEPYGNFTYEFNFTTDYDCTNVLFSNRSDIQMDKYGRGFIDLNYTAGIANFLCEYRNDTLRKVHQLTEAVFRIVHGQTLNFTKIYASNVTADWLGLTYYGGGEIMNLSYTYADIGISNMNILSSSPSNNIKIGNAPQASFQSISIGDGAISGYGGVALGHGANHVQDGTTLPGVAIGDNAQSLANGVAIGPSSSSLGGIALGLNSAVAIAVGDTAKVIELGEGTAEDYGLNVFGYRITDNAGNIYLEADKVINTTNITSNSYCNSTGTCRELNSWSFNSTYNTLLNQNCPANRVVNGTYPNGTFTCIVPPNPNNYVNQTGWLPNNLTDNGNYTTQGDVSARTLYVNRDYTIGDEANIFIQNNTNTSSTNIRLLAFGGYVDRPSGLGQLGLTWRAAPYNRLYFVDTNWDTYDIYAGTVFSEGSAVLIAESDPLSWHTSGTTTLTGTNTINLNGNNLTFLTSAVNSRFQIQNTGGVTTISGASSGNPTVTFCSNTGTMYCTGGTDVSVADGGSGRSSATAYSLIAGGTTTTGAHQSIANSATTGTILRSAGTSALPAWSTATYPSTTVNSTILYATNTNVIGSSSALTFNGRSLNVTGSIIASQNITTSNLNVTGSIIASQNITTSNLNVTGSIIASQNITTSNLNVTGSLIVNNSIGISGSWNCTSYPNVTISGGIITSWAC